MALDIKILLPRPLQRRIRPQVADADLFECSLEDARQAAGIGSSRSAAIDTGAPVLALTFLALALPVAWLAPDAGQRPAIAGMALLLIACLPWLRWLAVGDEGPSWTFAIAALAPLAVLVTGQWFASPVALNSGSATPLLAFPGLFVIVIGIAAAPVRLAVGMTILAWLAFAAPQVAAWLADRGVSAQTVMTWQVIYALAPVTGYALRMSFQAASAVNQARDALTRQSIEEERRRIARDVHDMVAHTLAVTMLHMTAARMAVRRQDPAAAEEALAVAERHGRESLGDIRRMVHLLRDDAPGDAAPQPGIEEIEDLVERYRAAGLPVNLTLEVEDGNAATHPGTGLAIYRILQEALANAAKHGTGPATVHARVTPAGITLRVSNPAAIRVIGRHQGSGVIGMQERCGAAGGSLSAGLHQGEWIVEAKLPAVVA
jgi:signal transduction histidine kinase